MSKPETIKIEFIPREIQHSEFDWADLSLPNNDRVGKVRCKINSKTVTIFSINVYPDHKGCGFGRQFVEFCQENFEKVIADRVRPTAIGFWEKMGFKKCGEDTWMFVRN